MVFCAANVADSGRQAEYLLYQQSSDYAPAISYMRRGFTEAIRTAAWPRGKQDGNSHCDESGEFVSDSPDLAGRTY